MKNLGMMSWLNYLFLSREVRWKWYGELEEKGGRKGREVLGGRDWEERKEGRAEGQKG